MRVFKLIQYTYSKKDSAIDLFDRTKNVLNDLNKGSVSCLFHLSDHYGRHASAVQRAVNKFPELKKYEFIASKNFGDGPVQYKVLSNFSCGIRCANPNGVRESLDFDLLYDISKGIPRSFPFNEATFVFNGVDWFNNGSVNKSPVITSSLSDILSYASSSILISSEWGFYSRYNIIIAKVELNIPNSNEASLPELGSEVKKILMRLGKIKSETVISMPNPEEQELLGYMNEKAKHTIEKYNEVLQNVISTILPHCDIPQIRNELIPYSKIAIKKYIINTFKKRGYIYKSNLSEVGLYYTVKRTENNNQIKLLFETGKYHNLLFCKFIYQGPLWIQELDVQFTTFKGGICYQISDEQLLQKLFDNIAAVVDYLENTLVKELDEIYGSAPRWYEYQK